MNSIQPELFLVMLKIIQLRFVIRRPSCSIATNGCCGPLPRFVQKSPADAASGLDASQNEPVAQPAHAQGLYKNDGKSLEMKKIRYRAAIGEFRAAAPAAGVKSQWTCAVAGTNKNSYRRQASGRSHQPQSHQPQRRLRGLHPTSHSILAAEQSLASANPATETAAPKVRIVTLAQCDGTARRSAPTFWL